MGMAEPTPEQIRETLSRVAPLLSRIRKHMLGLSIRGDRDLERDLLKASVLAQIGNVLDKDRAIFDLLAKEAAERNERIGALYDAAGKARDVLYDIQDDAKDIAKPLTLKQARDKAREMFYSLAEAIDAIDKAGDTDES